MDVRVQHYLYRKACVEVVIAGYPAKVVGVVATQIRKNFAGVNMGRVIEVMYDRDDHIYKKNLIKVKSLFGGGGQTYMEIFTEHRDWSNKGAWLMKREMNHARPLHLGPTIFCDFASVIRGN